MHIWPHLLSSAAFAATSLCMSKQIVCGFLDLMFFFCGLLVMQLMQIKPLLVFVGTGFGFFRVQRGINLARRDVISSDPYVIIRMGKQTLKTRVVRKNVNPEWNDDLTLSSSDPHPPVQLFVYDKDTFTVDDKMVDAEFEIGPFLEAVKMRFESLPNDTIVTMIQPSRQNCLAEESQIVWKDGKMVQNMVLRLRNVECGEVELQLHWIDIRGSKGL